VIEVEGIHKTYGTREVLRGVDLHVEPRAALVVLGPSGSGKSTLLRCVAALEPFEAGRVTIDGEQIGYREDGGRRKRLPEGTLAHQRSEIGMVFQSFNLFPHMTALQNVMLGLVHVRKQPKDVARATAMEWLARVGLGDRGDAFPAQLSGGQQQRVAIARACATKPKVVLLDEVTSALDPELVGEVLKVIKDLSLAGVTMLVVTHEVLFAREVAHEVVFIDEGAIVESGTPDDILTNPRTERFQAFLKRYSNVSMRTS